MRAEHLLDFAEQPLPIDRQDHPARHAREEGQPESLLEALDMCADSWLAQVQRHRSARDRAFSRDRDEGLELAQVQGGPSMLRQKSPLQAPRGMPERYANHNQRNAAAS